MKNHGRYITIVTFVALAKVGVAVAAPCAPDAHTTNEFARPQTLAFPDFCDIPAKPKGIPTAQAFRAKVVRTRVAGAVTVQQSAPDTFTLSDTVGFAERAKAEGAPPPPMSPSSEADTEAFVRQSKAKATPPHRPR
ncbi:MAG TPA: hypothetical protein VGF33_08700 [Caulobacteraceae bacterium]|jgi:hypothetical protein